MRTFLDWRDLPPVPRIAANNDVKALSKHCNSQCSASRVISLSKSIRPDYESGDLDSDSEEDIFVPRKRTCRKHDDHHSDERHHIQKENTIPVQQLGKPQSLEDTVTKNRICPQNAPSHPLSISPVREGTTSVEASEHESSDEEPVLRVTRRSRNHIRASCSHAQEPSRSNTCLSASRDRNCSSDHYDTPSRSCSRSKKRRSSASPLRCQRKDNGKLLKRRRSAAEEPLLLESSPVSECDKSQEILTGGSSRRRRCARKSTGSVTVPWYLLDEERTPRRLRSSSRNCAARCVYWTKTEHRLFYIDKSPIHNIGLYTREDIPAFVPVIEYAGEIITQIQSEVREWAYQTRHMEEVYMYQLRKGTTSVIDGTLRGGPAKFVNHSCEPNVVAEEIHAGGTNRVWFFSLRPIRKHEEILVDYCLSYESGDVKRPCMCRATTCKKYLNYYGLVK